MTRFVCVACGTQFPDDPRLAGGVSDLRGRAPVRARGRSAVDDAGGARGRASQRHPHRGRAGRGRHRAALRDRPAGPARPVGRVQPAVGLRDAARRRRPPRRSSAAAAWPGSRSPTRTTTRRWSSGRTASPARSTCTRPTRNGSCARTTPSRCGAARRSSWATGRRSCSAAGTSRAGPSCTGRTRRTAPGRCCRVTSSRSSRTAVTSDSCTATRTSSRSQRPRSAASPTRWSPSTSISSTAPGGGGRAPRRQGRRAALG